MASMGGSAAAIEVTLPLVEYSLEVAAGQAGRWQVLELTLSEQLSEPYRCTLELAEIGEGGDPDALLGASGVLELERDGVDERRLCGVICRVTYRGLKASRVVVSVEVVPALSALSQRVNTKIFQEMTVPDILKEVLEVGLGPFDRTVKLDLRETYNSREYCVQYRESDLAFATRLMRECGIAYRFDHSDDTEKLVLFDANDACSQWEASSGRAIPIALDNNELLGIESIRTLTWREEMRPNRVVVRDFDWTQPALDLTRRSEDSDGVEGEREIYESSPIVSIGDYDDGSKAYGNEEVQTQAQITQQAEVAQIRAANGTSNVIGLVPGVIAQIAGHRRPELDGRYLVVSVAHGGISTEGVVRGINEVEAEQQYDNRLTLLPFDIPYRPARPTERLTVLGPQTATVVGPSSEEVYTDAHGRIKVQFHWDRLGEKDENSSCWVRVAQSWAGPGYGTMFIPRIGMEVVVAFLDGDPNRPLVVGVVYNGQNPPPYDLPTDKTKSGIYTRSSPEGTGRNEITFEDAKDSEELFTHAQKDMNTVVKNDKTLRVDHDEAILVKNDRSLQVDHDKSEVVQNDKSIQVTGQHTEDIGKDMTLSVGANLKQTVGESMELTVSKDLDASINENMSQSVGADKSVTVSGDSTETVSKNKSVDVSKEMTVQVGEDCEFTVGKSLTESIQDEHQEIVGKEYTLKAKKIQLVADNQVHVKAGSAELILKKNGDITLKGKNINIKASSNVVVKGSKVAEN
jgi:type VI secretion system secreted protein VgrG